MYKNESKSAYEYNVCLFNGAYTYTIFMHTHFRRTLTFLRQDMWSVVAFLGSYILPSSRCLVIFTFHMYKPDEHFFSYDIYKNRKIKNKEPKFIFVFTNRNPDTKKFFSIYSESVNTMYTLDLNNIRNKAFNRYIESEWFQLI